MPSQHEHEFQLLFCAFQLLFCAWYTQGAHDDEASNKSAETEAALSSHYSHSLVVAILRFLPGSFCVVSACLQRCVVVVQWCGGRT